MNFIGKVMSVAPPTQSPPQTKRTTIHSERDTIIVSAAAKGFTATSSSTTTLANVSEQQANAASSYDTSET